MATNSAQAVILDQSELAYLMKLMGASTLVGMSPERLKMTESTETVVDHLRRKHILGTGNGKPSVDASYKPWLEALFAPSRALVIIRDLPKVGRQLLVFSARAGISVLHSLPSEGEHRVVQMSMAEIASLLDAWFPTATYAEVPAVGFQASLEEIDRSRELIEKGQTQDGLRELKGRNVSQETLDMWTETIQQRKYTGSFASLTIEGNELKQADSFSIIAGEDSAWLILQDGQSEQQLRVIRANAHCKDRILYAVQELSDVDGQQFTSVVLDTNSLAYSFAAISRPDLGARIIQSMRGADVPPEQMSSDMQLGAQTLTNRGLCIISPKGMPILSATLERVVFPLVRFDWVLEAMIARPNLRSEAVIHVQTGRSFTSHLITKDSHVLEHGSASKLSLYLEKLYADFARSSEAVTNDKFELALGQLRAMLRDSSQHFAKMLASAGGSSRIVPMLEKDLRHEKFNGWITKVNAGSQTREQQAKALPKPTMFLLQGVDHAWVVVFPDESDASQGTVQMVNSKAFDEVLVDFLSK